ncbi:MAG: transposase, partial [Firmicutes bacterium]|nr:transposase [Bacillota bacterium]
LKTGPTGYRSKPVLQEIYRSPDKATSEEGMWNLYWCLLHSQLESMKKLGRTIKAHWEEILKYFEAGRTNGILEKIGGLRPISQTQGGGGVTPSSIPDPLKDSQGFRRVIASRTFRACYYSILAMVRIKVGKSPRKIGPFRQSAGPPPDPGGIGNTIPRDGDVLGGKASIRKLGTIAETPVFSRVNCQTRSSCRPQK